MCDWQMQIQWRSQCFAVYPAAARLMALDLTSGVTVNDGTRSLCHRQNNCLFLWADRQSQAEEALDITEVSGQAGPFA